MRPIHFLPALFLLLCTALISCGKKGDPFLPAMEGGGGRVSGLKGEWDGKFVLLSGRIHEATGQDAGVRAYFGSYPVDQPPCDGCPIEYQGFQSFGPEVVSESVFSCEMTEIKPGNIYFFEVRVIGPGGNQGPPSNRVQVEVPEVR